MKILAIEFSSDRRSVAFVEARPDGSVRSAGEVVRVGGRATPALAMIAEVLAQAGVGRAAVECVAVGLGPGSYHGIRAGIALAQGWQLARGTQLLGLSSVEVIAAQAHADGLRGRLTIVVDAQHGDLYLADFELGASAWRPIQPLRIAPAVELGTTADANRLVVGPEVTLWVPRGQVVHPRAGMLGRLAAARRTQGSFAAGEALAPIYLREAAFVKTPASGILRARRA